MTMPRVLHLRSSAGFYGAERVLVTILSRLPQRDVTVHLALIRTHRNESRELFYAAGEAGIETSEIRCRGRIDPWAFLALRRLVSLVRADVIHTHDYKSHLYGWAVARLMGLPVIATCHGWISNTVNLRLYQRLERLLFRVFGAIVVVAPEMAEKLRAFDPRVHVISNGVDTECFTPNGVGLGRERWGFTPEHFVFATIGRLSPEKGQTLLVRAFAKVAATHPGARLLLVGEGPDRTMLGEHASDLGIAGRVEFAGQQSRIERLLHDVDCYVSPSLTEGMPMVLLEAMASARPIVATNVGAVGAMLAEGAGVVVPAGNAEALARAMSDMITEPGDRATMAALARHRACQHYSADRQVRAYADLYRQFSRQSVVARAGVA